MRSFVTVFVMFIALLSAGDVKSRGLATPSREIMESIVLVQCGDSLGSGFICEMDGEKWLVTNEHVIRGSSPIVASHISGSQLKLETVIVTNKKHSSGAKSVLSKSDRDVLLEVAADRDLIRVKVKTEASGLPIANDFDMYTKVHTFGNSDGAGVVTSLSGRIIGIGTDKVEVDIPFVQGNSGGAIINDEGSVLAVVTYATIRNEPDKWIKTGTRFNEVRRFGVRLNGVKWEKIFWSEYAARSRKIEELDACLEFLVDACVRPNSSIGKYEARDFGWIKDTTVKAAIRKVLKADDEFWKAFDRTTNQIEGYVHKSGTLGNSKSDIEFAFSRELLRAKNMREARASAITQVLPKIKKIPQDYWKAYRMRNEAASLVTTYKLLDEFMKSTKDVWAKNFLNNIYNSYKKKY